MTKREQNLDDGLSRPKKLQRLLSRSRLESHEVSGEREKNIGGQSHICRIPTNPSPSNVALYLNLNILLVHVLVNSITGPTSLRASSL